MTKYRNHECLNCKHNWAAKVRYSLSTQNVSGERSVWCPRCYSRNVWSNPIYEKDDNS